MKSFLLFITALLIYSSGFSQSQNVGIGTTTPAFKLDVRNGSINVDSVYRIGTNTVLSVSGTNTLFVGQHAGKNNSGDNNTFSGHYSGYSNTEGSFNSFFGMQSGVYNNIGSSNSFFGAETGFYNTTGAYNSFFGIVSGAYNTTGSSNSFFGAETGLNNTEGKHNSFFGMQAGHSNTTGSSNSFFGKSAGFTNTTGSHNTVVGDSANVNSGDLTNATAIGARSRVDCSNCVVLGSVNGINGATSGVNVGIGTVDPALLFQVAKNTSYETGNSYGIAATNATNTNLRLNLGYDAAINAAVIQASEEGVSFNKNLLLNPNAGNVGIGVNTPSAKLEVAGQVKITGGAPGVGKVLTSDASGLASWQPPPPPPPVNYPVVWICCNPWMTKNLDVSTYRNGDPIPRVTDDMVWDTLTTGAYCYNNNDSTNYAAYGKLYNWYAVNDPRGLAPEGWHIPTDFEWTTLSTCLGGDPVSGGPMKEIGTTHWTAPNTGATNLSGFTALPGGYRDSAGSFYSSFDAGIWWSSTESDAGYAWSRFLVNNSTDFSRSSLDNPFGFSVRCLRD